MKLFNFSVCSATLFLVFVELCLTQLQQVGLRNGNYPLRPYVYPVVVGGVQYFREYTRQQLRQQWGQILRAQLQSNQIGQQRFSDLRRYSMRMAAANQDLPYITTEQQIDEIYGSRAAVYDAPDSFHHVQGADYMTWARLKPGMKLLDLACGTGIVAFLAAAAVGSMGRVTGVDINDRMLERAKAKAEEKKENILFLKHDVSDLTELNLPKDWDVITCASAFIFMNDPRETLEHWATYLKPGGKIIFDVPTEHYLSVGRAINNAGSALSLPIIWDSLWVRGIDSVKMKILDAGMSYEVFESQTYGTKTYTLEEGLNMMRSVLEGPFGRIMTRTEEEKEQLIRLSEINYRTLFAEEMDENGKITDVNSFYVGIATKRL